MQGGKGHEWPEQKPGHAVKQHRCQHEALRPGHDPPRAGIAIILVELEGGSAHPLVSTGLPHRLADGGGRGDRQALAQRRVPFKSRLVGCQMTGFRDDHRDLALLARQAKRSIAPQQRIHGREPDHFRGIDMPEINKADFLGQPAVVELRFDQAFGQQLGFDGGGVAARGPGGCIDMGFADPTPQEKPCFVVRQARIAGWFFSPAVGVGGPGQLRSKSARDTEIDGFAWGHDSDKHMTVAIGY
ncbi:hypothetical protein [Hoeflea ulvae]|uniref:Uncharacterized protein n=1 Tax=Hoeflea ulvae TaxID=2983764 RepID=A0ABT3YBW8_9HYPH|nr:hypothetical protein [Hoeflea ulvae]MCY0093380.1 hypothetical protein [Hoeflea ulvae]